jgi:hypothetical protein
VAGWLVGITVFAGLAALAAVTVYRDENGGSPVLDRLIPVYDLIIESNGACDRQIRRSLQQHSSGVRLPSRTNVPVVETMVLQHRYGPTDWSTATERQARVAAVGCARKVEVVRSRRGDLCRQC